jgi:leader peptidase (prepilin peptidase) / N-methyltransferase
MTASIEITLVVVASAALGSFANTVLSYYLGTSKLDVLRSACRCGVRTLAVSENIPVASYIARRGRCRECSVRIPVRYVLIELLTILLGLSMFFRYSVSAEMAYNFIFLYVLMLICFIDYKKYMIPNLLVAILGATAVVYFIQYSPEVLYKNLIGGAGIGVLLLAINFTYNALRKTDGIGYGDIKLLIVLSLFYGLFFAIASLWIASLIVTAVFAIQRVTHKKIHARMKIPLGSYLCAAVALMMLAGGYVPIPFYY